MKKALICLLFLCLCIEISEAQNPTIQRIDPTNWWVGMRNPDLQLMIYGKDIKGSQVNINYAGVKIQSIQEVENWRVKPLLQKLPLFSLTI